MNSENLSLWGRFLVKLENVGRIGVSEKRLRSRVGKIRENCIPVESSNRLNPSGLIVLVQLVEKDVGGSL